MELAVALPALLGCEGMPAHLGEARFHALEVLARSALGSERGGGRLDDAAQLEQAVDEPPIGLARESPGEHVGIEEVPAVARKDSSPRLGAAFDQSLGDQRLDRFA